MPTQLKNFLSAIRLGYFTFSIREKIVRNFLTVKGMVFPRIKRCPFCGQKPDTSQLRIEPVWVVYLADGFRKITCNACGCSGPIAKSDGDAVARWNGNRLF